MSSSTVNTNAKFSRLKELPSLSPLLMDALQMLNTSYDSHTLAEKIGQDPPISAKILRIANSPFYGRAREIGSLASAIVLLGQNQIRDLLLSVCFTKALPEKHGYINYNLLWHHSMAVADLSRCLAELSAMKQELAYTAGLLHDIGRLAMVTLYTEAYLPLFNNPGPPIAMLEQERSLFGFDHAEIGSEMARKWNFPPLIQEAIAKHENPDWENTQKSLSMLVFAANLLIYQCQHGLSETQFLEEELNKVLAILAISAPEATEHCQNSLGFADHILTLL